MASKLAAALKQKFKTPRAALRALGLDESLLDDIVAGDAAPRPATSMRSLARRMGRDAGARDAYQQRLKVGDRVFLSKDGTLVRPQDVADFEDGRDNFPESRHFPGGSRAGTMRASEHGQDDEEDDSENGDLAERFPELAVMIQQLREEGLDDEQIETICNAVSENEHAAMDEPAPFEGMPTPGGGKVRDEYLMPGRIGVRAERSIPAHDQALRYAKRIGAIPTYGVHVQTPKQAYDSARISSARATSPASYESFAKRHPNVARIEGYGVSV